MKRLTAVLPPILWALAGPVLAQSQPFKPVEVPSEWSVNIGAGGVYGFSPTGGKANRLNVTPWGDFSWRDRVYGNPLDGLGYNVVKLDTVVQAAGRTRRRRHRAPGFGREHRARARQCLQLVADGRRLHALQPRAVGGSADIHDASGGDEGRWPAHAVTRARSSRSATEVGLGC